MGAAYLIRVKMASSKQAEGKGSGKGSGGAPRHFGNQVSVIENTDQEFLSWFTGE